MPDAVRHLPAVDPVIPEDGRHKAVVAKAGAKCEDAMDPKRL
jgi:hypothetical protein